MIDAVVFDLGGVLLDWDPRHLYRQLFASAAEMETFLSTVCTPAWHVQHDLGIEMAGSCAELAARHPDQAALITAWADRSEEMVRGEIDGSVALLAELKAAGVPCYALSNMERETFPVRRARFPFIDWFDGAVISGDEGVMKPFPLAFCSKIGRDSSQFCCKLTRARPGASRNGRPEAAISVSRLPGRRCPISR